MDHTPRFLAGKEVARQLFKSAIEQMMAEHAREIPYAAGLLGAGSDVLGYDTARSMDHDWGPRLTLLLRDEDLSHWRDRLNEVFREYLPSTIAGFPTRFHDVPDEPGTAILGSGGTVHRIVISSVSEFLDRSLGIHTVTGMDVATWVTVSEQHLLEVTAGSVFHDDCGDLTHLRAVLAYYPEDIWRYRMAAGWQRIAQIEPFVGRTGEVGDDLGSQVIGMSLAHDVMRLALLQARHYAPYSKWLGTAFARLPGVDELMPWLEQAGHATTWEDRETGIVRAVQVLAARHNALGVTEPVDPSPRPFHNRPFTVIDAERFAAGLMMSVQDPEVRSLPRFLGGIDQYLNSTDALVNPDLRHVIRQWLRAR